jgi:hypothetical protein
MLRVVTELVAGDVIVLSGDRMKVYGWINPVVQEQYPHHRDGCTFLATDGGNLSYISVLAAKERGRLQVFREDELIFPAQHQVGGFG